MSRRGAAAAVVLLLAAGACRRGPSEPFVTYFNGDHLVSVRYPAGWTEGESTQEGVWSRYFLAPAAGAQRQAAASATLVAGPTAGTLDQYAQSYLAGHNVTSTAEATRQGVTGRSWRFVAADGSRRYALLLLQDAGHVWGLYSQAEAAAYDTYKAALDAMEESLTLERPATYTEHAQPRYGFSLRVPPSWKTGQTFGSGGTFLLQLISPPLGYTRRQAQHASLTLNVEPAAGGGALEAYRKAVRDRLGEAYKLQTEVAWRGGYVDLLRAETPLAVSSIKRYYWTSGGRGFSLSCEAQEDTFYRVTRWCDVIASTLQIDGRPLPESAPVVARPAASPTPRPLIAR